VTIINIRGTSGSGKSTVARQLMALYQPNPLRYREEGRKQPLGYRYKNPLNQHQKCPSCSGSGHRGMAMPDGTFVRCWTCVGNGMLVPEGHHRDLAVVGHYETDCGGADTIPDYAKLIYWVKAGADAGMDVLFEGLLFSGDVVHTIRLNEWCKEQGHELRVVAMQMDLQLCVDSINLRRNAKAQRLGRPPKPPVNPKNTIAKHKGLTLACSRLEQANVTVHRPVGREATFNLCKQLLRLP
jgi:hypothetical protein